MSIDFDIDRLGTILRDAAKAEVLPRFRRLSAVDVRQKTSATDLVTEADEAAERFIKAACAEAFPEAVFVGEESASADPSLLDAVAGSALSIVVDPIDGTANYAAGAPLFAVMAAVVSRGRTIAGIIYDPMGDDFMVAEAGGGAFFVRPDGTRARLDTAAPLPLSDLVGCASHAYADSDLRADLLRKLAQTRIIANYRCAGHEYRLLASGHLHYSMYHKLMPGDHLAGVLILSEAGGHSRRLDGSHYRPGDVDGVILNACEASVWQAVHTAIS